MKLRQGDSVVIISGKDRGKTGKIIKALPKEGKIVVEGAWLKKKHVRPRRGREKGQVVSVPAAFSASNAKLICPKCGKAVRVGYRVEGEKKYRVCKKCESAI